MRKTANCLRKVRPVDKVLFLWRHFTSLCDDAGRTAFCCFSLGSAFLNLNDLYSLCRRKLDCKSLSLVGLGRLFSLKDTQTFKMECWLCFEPVAHEVVLKIALHAKPRQSNTWRLLQGIYCVELIVVDNNLEWLFLWLRWHLLSLSRKGSPESPIEWTYSMYLFQDRAWLSVFFPLWLLR